MARKERKKSGNGVRRRAFFSRLLVGGVRLLLLPLTLLFTVLVFVWSLPFRLWDMAVRARHPFLCATALERFVEEGDSSVRFWDLYCAFRYRSLSRTDSLFNAYYTRLSVNAHRFGTEARAPRGVFQHPFGWYRKDAERKARPAATFHLKLATFLPRLLRFFPNHVGVPLRKLGRAMENSQTAIGGAVRFLRRRGTVLLAFVLVFAVGGIIGYVSSMDYTFAVRIDGETIGFVESRQALQEAVYEVESNVSEALGMTFKLPKNISYALTKHPNPVYLSKEELVDELSVYTTDYVRVGYALYVDGTLVCASDSESKLRDVLERAEARAQKKNREEEIRLLSDTRILYCNCPVDAFLSDEELESLLTVDEKGEKVTALKLSAYQPRILPLSKKLSDGEAYCYTLNYSATDRGSGKAPTLVYGTSAVEEAEQSVPFNITYRESDTIYEGSQYVHQTGKAGKKLITYTVYYSGDKEHSREILSEATLQEPSDQIVLIGTKPLPTFAGEDGAVDSQKIFIAPVYGDVSSYFGLRDMNNDGILESGHSGIDIPATDGTPLYAAGSGVVLEAGETGNSYGIAVKILHENGLCTYYAHLSAVTVKVGQTVSQNQMIGNVGMTGYVTGAHVHFEVRLPSGVQVNPINYLIGY